MNNYNKAQIKSHLALIKQSIKDDVGSVLSVYSGNMCGFFAIPRLLFPEIDGLGSFITGDIKSNTENIVTYFKLILSKIDSRYEKFAVFMTFVYRHGLLHQHSPKKFKYKNKEVGWIFNISHTNNPLEVQREYHLVFRGDLLQIDMNLFYNDVFNSIDILEKMITIKYTNEFTKAVKDQTTALNKTAILKKKNYKKFIKKSDFNFL